ncbi:MAG: BREX-6 system adenine-specific DNA-methyltransferase PglX, partial [Polyangiaceae bacterium]
EGVLNVAPATALPAGILFVGPDDAYPDSLTHPSLAPVLAAWSAFTPASTPASGKKPTLRDWLRKDFFAYHKGLYENRPIYFPLSSEKKTFVAWVSIHRFTDATLRTVLADHLAPVLRQLDGEIADASAARTSSDKKTAIAAGKAFDTAVRLRDELSDFIAKVTQCADPGALPTDPGCPPREVGTSFSMDLDDGVMINSAALWPLLSPQWSDPKKWWKQLCLAEGRKDYDWAHLAKRYFPARVDAKCRTDPSLAVAHGCFWKYHPAKAFEWELRLQDEIRAGFTIDEVGSDGARDVYLKEHAAEAEAAREKERVRRERKAARAGREDEGDDASEATDAGEDDDEARTGP